MPKRQVAGGMSEQIKSRERVAEHGEVFTNEREVNAMLDMVRGETERIDSRFLEPACGNGNFLAEVLRRKLAVVGSRYGRSPAEYMRYAFVSAASLDGVDILEDNAAECRARLCGIVDCEARSALGGAVETPFLDAVRYVVGKNVLCGDALTLRDAGGSPIVFAEWSMVTGDLVKRRDFMLSELLEANVGEGRELSLFDVDALEDGVTRPHVDWEYDEETRAYIPSAVREYPVMDYREVGSFG